MLCTSHNIGQAVIPVMFFLYIIIITIIIVEPNTKVAGGSIYSIYTTLLVVILEGFF